MNRLLPVLAASVLLLSGCTGTPASDNAAACRQYTTVLSDGAVSGGTGAVAQSGVAIKLRTEAASLADDELAGHIKVMGAIFEENPDLDNLTGTQSAAGPAIKETCAALGIEW
ncbi:hypothetical protein [Microterricola viridarii]|uniref:hypothetical protein n=1 Tax=Microterricola viridarii TaxID=412690 RepID=UPI0012EAB752|nr:hypothetical protein [Microterricola viridarii]